jgi:hypothetical protein
MPIGNLVHPQVLRVEKKRGPGQPAQRWLNTRRAPPEVSCELPLRWRRELEAYRRSVFIAGDQANASLSRDVRGAAADFATLARLYFTWRRPNRSAMAALGIAHHGHANALEKPVIAGFAAGDGLVVHIPRRFWHKVKNVFANTSTNANNACCPIREL